MPNIISIPKNAAGNLRCVRVFAPAWMPLLSRPAYRLELGGTVLLSCALGFVEGGTVSVFLKQTFAGTTPERWHNLAVALAASAGEVANIVSFFWITTSHGRSKVRVVNVLQVGAMISIASVALAGRTAAGLWLALASVVLTRIFWSGIVTLRTNIWRANYPREVRARVVGRLAIASQATLAVVGFLVGSAIDSSKDSYQGFTPLLAGIGLMGALVYGRIRMRGERAVLEAERASPVAGEVMRPWMGLVSTYRVLRADRRFAQFNLFMFILGLGNLMLMPVLAIALSKRFALGANPGKMCVLITSTLPGVLNPIAVPVWARLLDRSHVVRFRAIHAWFFVLATLLFAIGAQTLSVGVMIVAACVLGIAMGGGALAWNLGHTDFAPPARTAHYMATHVTLNGLRGLMAPFIAVFLYNAMTDGHGESRWASIEPAAVVLSISLALNIAGALGFVWLRGSMGASAGLGRREG